MANDYARDVAQSIIRQLDEGVAPWTKPWQPGERFMPYNPTTGNEYHGMNALWLLSVAQTRGYDDPRWMTYRQASAKGAQVRKGERAATIQYWKWEEYQDVLDERGQPVLGENGKPKQRVVRYERPRVWSAAVFNAAQIDGLPPPADRASAPEWGRHQSCELILGNSGVAIHYRSGDRALYNLARDEIVLPERQQFLSPDAFYATALHELGHATGHPSRLARDLSHPFGSEGYAREELRAEIATLMVGEQLQIGHDPRRHAAYVGSWIKALEADPREIFRAAADAEKITTLVRSYELEQQKELTASHTPPVSVVGWTAKTAGALRLGPADTTLAAKYENACLYADWDYSWSDDVTSQRSGAETVRKAHEAGRVLASKSRAAAELASSLFDRLVPQANTRPDWYVPDAAREYEATKGGDIAFRSELVAARAKADRTAKVGAQTLIRENHPAMSTKNSDRTYLAVPYDDKDKAKALGAKWDARQKAWYAPAGTNIDDFRSWLPVMGAAVMVEAGSDPRAEFTTALRDGGLIVDGRVEMDGKLHRVRVEGDKGPERSGAYTGYLDGRPAGWIQNFRSGTKTTWKASGAAKVLSSEERAQLAADAAQRRHDRVREREETWRRTAQEVSAMLMGTISCDQHPYLAAKNVRSHGLRQDEDGRLLVPVHDEHGTIWSVQKIGPDGFKHFAEGGRVEGGHFVIGDLQRPGPLLIAEGYATAATIHELTEQPAIVAFNAGNLPRVASIYRERFPERTILIAGDDDRHVGAETGPDGRPKQNVGREKAEEAAAAIGGKAVFPVFPAGDKGTDWNDLARSRGKKQTGMQLRVAFHAAERTEAARDGAGRGVLGRLIYRPRSRERDTIER